MKIQKTPTANSKVVKMKTKWHLCTHWLQGACERGRMCGWAHGQQEIGMQVKNPQGLKTTLCKYFAAGGFCQKTSEECEFAHGEQELGKKKPAVPANQKKGGKEEKGRNQGCQIPLVVSGTFFERLRRLTYRIIYLHCTLYQVRRHPSLSFTSRYPGMSRSIVLHTS